jgi:hypothetical protein
VGRSVYVGEGRWAVTETTLYHVTVDYVWLGQDGNNNATARMNIYGRNEYHAKSRAETIVNNMHGVHEIKSSKVWREVFYG